MGRKKKRSRNLFDTMHHHINTPPHKRFKGDGWFSCIQEWIMPFIILLVNNAEMISFMDPLIPSAIVIFSIIYTPTAFFDAQRNVSLARFGITETFSIPPNTRVTAFVTLFTGWIDSLNSTTQSGYRTIFPRLLYRLNDFRTNGQAVIDNTRKAIMDFNDYFGKDVCSVITEYVGTNEAVVFDLYNQVKFIWETPVSLWQSKDLQDFITLCMPHNQQMVRLVQDLCFHKSLNGSNIVYNNYGITINEYTKGCYGYGNISFCNYLFSGLRKFDLLFDDVQHPLTYYGDSDYEDNNFVATAGRADAFKYL